MSTADTTATHQSHTLSQLKTLPESACVGCPNAVWHLVSSDKGKKEELRVYCQLMHALIDDPMTMCDGKYMVREE